MKTQYLRQDIFPPKQERSVFQTICALPSLVGRKVVWLYNVVHFMCIVAINFGLPDVRVCSEYVEAVISRPVKLRHLFLTNDTIRVFPMRKSHSHPKAAAFRTATNIYMGDLARTAGYVPYNVSKSPTDSGDGTRYFYGVKDLAAKYIDTPVNDNHVLIFCDVDYYTDLNKWMKYFQPMIMYTFSPNTCVGRCEDYSWRFVDNQVEYHVAGGSSYRHELWNFTGDTVCSYADNGDLLVYLLEQRNIENDPNHRFVVFTPCARIPSPFHWFLREVPRLQRKEVTVSRDVGWWSATSEKFSLLYDPISDMLSIAKNGAWQSVDTTGRIYEAIKQRLDNKTAPAVVSDVERLLRAAGDKEAATNAPLLYNMFGLTIRHNVVKTTNVPTHYSPIGSLATEDGKPSGAQITGPLVSEPALFPTKGVNSDEATIRGRVDKVRNNITPRRAYKDYAHEFVDLIVRKPCVGSPLAVGDVQKRQATAQQRARFKMVEATLTTTPQNRLKAFIKSEAYGSVNDPRNITTMAPELTVMLSAYTLAFKEQVLKMFSWYGPGCNPTETVKRLAKLATSKLNWLCTDYSRLDGSVSEFLQKQVVYPCYMKWVAPEYRDEMKHLLDQVFIQRARTAEQVEYDPGYGTRSGSPITTDGNTIISAFVVYCANRNLGLTPKQSFGRLGLKYGDDGADSDYPGLSDAIELAAKALGLTVKLETVELGKPVPYLGRYFVDPATSKDSFQDPMRTLPKLHLTANRGVSAEQAAANKAHGYLATDAKTPIIGNWARRVIELTGLKPKGLLREETHRMSNAWPQRDASAIAESMAFVMGMQVSDLQVLSDSCNTVPALDQFAPLIETSRDVKISAVVSGDLVEPEPRVIAEPAPSDDRKSAATSGKLRPLANKSIGRRAVTSSTARVKAARVRGQVPTTRNGTEQGQQRGRRLNRPRSRVHANRSSTGNASGREAPHRRSEVTV
ncbi:protein A [Mosinovirus]|nr:protein A [Mosinovirus]